METQKTNERQKINPVLILGIIAIISLTLNILLYSLMWEPIVVEEVEAGIDWFWIYSSGTMVGWAVITTVCFFLLLKNFGLKSGPGKGWLLLALGFMIWAIGDATFMYYTVGLGLEDPFPTYADLFWAIAYPFLILGVILHLHYANVKISVSEKVIVAVITIVIAVAAIWYIFVPVGTSDFTTFLTSNGEPIIEPALQQFLLLYYPILDLVLLPSAIILAFKYRGGEFSKAWVIISLGFLVTVFFDIFYTWFKFQAYTNFDFENAYFLMDHIYIGYYMVLSLGALFMWKTIRALK